MSDLILEHDLQGILIDFVYKVMELTKFSGEFASIWGHFIASETFDDLEKLLCGKGRTGTESAGNIVILTALVILLIQMMGFHVFNSFKKLDVEMQKIEQGCK